MSVSLKTSAHPSYKMMALAAIAASSHFGHGTTRQAIAKYIKANYGCNTAVFNSALRKALAAGVASGIMVYGDNAQRFKLTDAGRALRNPPKRKKSKKKSSSTKQRALTKKKAAAFKKKKKKKQKESEAKKKKALALKKKKEATKKKKAVDKKNKAAAEKKAASKKKKKKVSDSYLQTLDRDCRDGRCECYITESGKHRENKKYRAPFTGLLKTMTRYEAVCWCCDRSPSDSSFDNWEVPRVWKAFRKWEIAELLTRLGHDVDTKASKSDLIIQLLKLGTHVYQQSEMWIERLARFGPIFSIGNSMQY